MDSLNEQFAALVSGLPDQTTSEVDRPLTTFEVLDTATADIALRSCLAYLLDPAAAHGLESTFLEAVLTRLREEDAVTTDIDTDTLSQESIHVAAGRYTVGASRPAIAIASTEGWVVCLVIAPGATGTQRTGSSLQTEITGHRTVEAIQADLGAAKQAIADLTTQKKRLEIQKRRLEEQVERHEEQAQEAVDVDREDLARRALEQKDQKLAQIEDLEAEIHDLDLQQEDHLVEKNNLEDRLDTARTQTEIREARQAAARAMDDVTAHVEGSQRRPVVARAIDGLEETDRSAHKWAVDVIMLKPGSVPTAKTESAVTVDWDALGPVCDTVRREVGDIPAETKVQLTNIDSVCTPSTTMTDSETTRQQKNTYFEYREAIETADAAVETFVRDVLSHEWASAVTDPARYEPATEHLNWIPDQVGDSIGELRPEYWVTVENELNDTTVCWEHRPTRQQFEAGRLTLSFVLQGEETDTDVAESSDPVGQVREKIADDLETKLADQTDARWVEYGSDPLTADRQLCRVVYAYDPGDERGYYQSLQFALEDTVPVTALVSEQLVATEGAPQR